MVISKSAERICTTGVLATFIKRLTWASSGEDKVG
jgi:hypothetical protein